MKPQLVVAIDEADVKSALDLVAKTRSRVEWYKVGYEAYYGYGDRIIAALHEAGKSVFLDLKLHDIPKTVAAGVRAAVRAGAALLTVHSAGGRAMLEAAASARDSLSPSSGRLRLLAVTALTSMSAADLRETGVDKSPSEVAAMRARLAESSGIDGVVCAVAEASAVHGTTGSGFLILCPGIRPAGVDDGDQRRVATPAEAALARVDFIVVGRAIARAADPAAAAEAIVREIEGVVA